MKKIYVIIPAYNEEQRIGKVIGDVKKYKLPIIVVDDGSSDNTFEVAKSQRVNVVRHKINMGSSKGAALKTGIEAAIKLGADAVILMDSDGQHRAKDIPKFVKKISSDKYDIVFGSRNTAYGVPIVRFMGNKIGSILVSVLFGIYVSDLLCGFRALTVDAYEKIKWDSIRYGVETEMVVRTAKNGLNYCEVPVATLYLDKYKGVTILDSIGILFDVLRWKMTK